MRAAQKEFTRSRLIDGAVEIFAERGYAKATVDEIADRAGLTERTFFRHFADKREVLFAGQGRLLEVYAATIAAAPGPATPLDLVAAALQAGTPTFEEHREFSRQRQVIVDSQPELRDREELKRAAPAAVLPRRGVAEPGASLAAEIGVIAFKTAFGQWVRDPAAPSLSQLIDEALAQLRLLAA